MPARRKVHSDLVRAPGVQGAAQAAEGIRPQEQLDIRRRVLAGGDHRHADARLRIAADRRIDAQRAPRHRAMGDREVFAMHVARRDGAHEGGHGLQGLADHHQPRGVLVQPVHDAGTRQRRRARIARQQAVEHCARPVAGRRMHHQAGRLVDDQQVLVLEHHRQRHGLGAKRLALRRRHQLDDDALACQHLARRAGHRAILDPHVAALDQGLHMAARELGHEGHHRLVEARGVQRARHQRLALFRLVAPRGVALGRRVGFEAGLVNGPNPIIRAHFSTGRRSIVRAISS